MPTEKVAARGGQEPLLLVLHEPDSAPEGNLGRRLPYGNQAMITTDLNTDIHRRFYTQRNVEL